MNKKLLLTGVVAVIVSVVIGYFAYPHTTVRQIVGGTASPSGTSFGTQRQATQAIQTGTTTIYSQFNGDSSDRIVDETFCFLPQWGPDTAHDGGVTTFTVRAATSSNPYNILTGASAATSSLLTVVQSLASTSNPQYSWFIVQVATSTGLQSSNGAFASTSLIWPAGTYMNFISTLVLSSTSTSPTQGSCGTQFFSI